MNDQFDEGVQVIYPQGSTSYGRVPSKQDPFADLREKGKMLGQSTLAPKMTEEAKPGGMPNPFDFLGSIAGNVGKGAGRIIGGTGDVLQAVNPFSDASDLGQRAQKFGQGLMDIPGGASEAVTGIDLVKNIPEGVAAVPMAFGQGMQKFGGAVANTWDNLGWHLQNLGKTTNALITGDYLTKEDYKESRERAVSGTADAAAIANGLTQALFSPISGAVQALPDEAKKPLVGAVQSLNSMKTAAYESIGVQEGTEDARMFDEGLQLIATALGAAYSSAQASRQALRTEAAKAAASGKALTAAQRAALQPTAIEKGINGLRAGLHNMGAKVGQYADDLIDKLDDAAAKAFGGKKLHTTKVPVDKLDDFMGAPTTLGGKLKEARFVTQNSIDDIIAKGPDATDDLARLLSKKTNLPQQDLQLILGNEKLKKLFVEQNRIAAQNIGIRGADTTAYSVAGREVSKVLDKLDDTVSKAGAKKGEMIKQYGGKQMDTTGLKQQIIDQAKRDGVTFTKDGVKVAKASLAQGNKELVKAYQFADDYLRLASQKAGKISVSQADQLRRKLFEYFSKVSKQGLDDATTSKAVSLIRGGTDDLLAQTLPSGYKAANQTYATGVNAIRDYAKYLGLQKDKLANLSDDVTGLLKEMRSGEISKRLMGAAGTRPSMELQKLFQSAGRMGIKADYDDVKNLARFADVLDDVYGTTQTTGFRGGIERAVEGAVQGKSGIISQAQNAITDNLRRFNLIDDAGVAQQQALTQILQAAPKPAAAGVVGEGAKQAAKQSLGEAFKTGASQAAKTAAQGVKVIGEKVADVTAQPFQMPAAVSAAAPVSATQVPQATEAPTFDYGFGALMDRLDPERMAELNTAYKGFQKDFLERKFQEYTKARRQGQLEGQWTPGDEELFKIMEEGMDQENITEFIQALNDGVLPVEVTDYVNEVLQYAEDQGEAAEIIDAVYKQIKRRGS